MSNLSKQLSIATYRHSVESGGGWGKMVDAYGACIIDFTDNLGSGPLGNAHKVADAIMEQLDLNDAEVLTFIGYSNLSGLHDGIVIVGDQEYEVGDLKVVAIDTTL